MGKSKTSLFSPESVRLSEIGKCFSHPARVEIIEFLLNTENCVCGDIVSKLPLSQSTVSQHLKELKLIGLIKGNISGPNVCYCIDKEVWGLFKMELNRFFAQEPVAENCDTTCC